MARQLEVVGLDWETEFVPWFRVAWEPGDHLSVIAPTKAGKSTFVAQLLTLRDYALALDPKGGDETIMKLGWPRLDRWPTDRELERLLDKAERGPSSLDDYGTTKTRDPAPATATGGGETFHDDDIPF